MFKITGNTNLKSKIDKISEQNGISIYKINLKWNLSEINEDSYAQIGFENSMCDIHNFWNPTSQPLAENSRVIKPNWDIASITSCTTKSAPIMCFYGNDDQNTFTFALSETKKLIKINYGTNEQTGNLTFDINIGLMQYTNIDETDIYVYINRIKKPMYEAIKDVTNWWECDLGITPLNVPDAAFEPLYSFWYSYHQEVYADKVEAECKLAKEFGFDNVIVDDGWQTDDNSGGYAYCGDWEISKNKMPDFGAHVKKVHDMGIAYMIWFSVPFVGYKSKAWDVFKDKILYKIDRTQTAVLDPRYPEVRSYLSKFYRDFMRNWNLDGLKLDFIDRFIDTPEAPLKPGMDIPSVQDAADKLMTDVKDAIIGYKPDAMIEFRQTYIGPNIRKYGNILRATDCPYDHLSNRASVLDLRLLSGKTAVHSDMLMWSMDESVESAAVQIINTIFSVEQISVKLATLPKDHAKMLKFWISFMKEHKDLLLKSNISVSEPHHYYTSATAYDDNSEITAVYSNNKCISISKPNSIVINGTGVEEVICKFDTLGTYSYTVQDCMGNIVEEKSVLVDTKVMCIDVPKCGLVTFKLIK